MKSLPILCLMGPTGSGKTHLAIELVKRFPCEIISVDSAMVFRGMDIGTAKPSADMLAIAPHRLIDILDPSEAYSAGQFRDDAMREIDAVIAQNKIPLLVGGTMMYFRVLQQGIAKLPHANPTIRAKLKARAAQAGWDALYAELQTIDPRAAKRIHANDSQRIQRALEVYLLTGKPISAWQEESTHPLANGRFCNLILAHNNRAHLHEQLAKRFQHMLQAGFVAEVESLFKRGDLSADHPSIRSVGYRQVWAHLEGELNFEEMCDQAISATRQLAKRQLTWLRTWPDSVWFDAEAAQLYEDVANWFSKQFMRG